MTDHDDEQQQEPMTDKAVAPERRDFLRSLGKWSQAVIGGVVVGGALTTAEPAQAWDNSSWYNRHGGGGWFNRHGGGGGWFNRHGGGGGWFNRHGGGGGWYNRHRGGDWFNRHRGGDWFNRHHGGGWYNR